MGKHSGPADPREVLVTSAEELAEDFDAQWQESHDRAAAHGDPSLSPTFLAEDRTRPSAQ